MMRKVINCIILSLLLTIFLYHNGNPTFAYDREETGKTELDDSGAVQNLETAIEISENEANSFNTEVDKNGDSNNNYIVQDNSAMPMQTSSMTENEINPIIGDETGYYENNREYVENYNNNAIQNMTSILGNMSTAEFSNMTSTTLSNEDAKLENITGNIQNKTQISNNDTIIVHSMSSHLENITKHIVNETNDSTSPDSQQAFGNTTNYGNNGTLNVTQKANNTFESLDNTAGGIDLNSTIDYDENPLQNTETENETMAVSAENTTMEYENETLDNQVGQTHQHLNSTIERNSSASTSCSFPEGLVGDWWSSLWGPVSFFGNRVQIKVKNHTSAMECYIEQPSEELIILREQLNETFPQRDILYTCIAVEKQKDNRYFVWMKTAMNDMYENKRVVSLANNTSMHANDLLNTVCNDKSSGVYQLFIRKGKEIESAIQCPSPLSGNFVVNFTELPKSTRCPQGAEVTSCDGPMISFDYASCNGPAGLTNKDDFVCVHQDGIDVTIFQFEDTNGKDTNPLKHMIIRPNTEISTAFVVNIWSEGFGDYHSSNATYTFRKTGECPNQEPETTFRPDNQTTNSPTHDNRTNESFDTASSMGHNTLLMTVGMLLIPWITSLGF